MRKLYWALIAALALMLAGVAHAGPGYHGNLFDESPTVLSGPGALDTAQAQADATAGYQAGFQIPWATVSQRGCRTRQIPVNWSSRSGADPALLVLHYTVSSNRGGWGDVDAIRSWFSQSRAQASSHYIIDFEGNCAYIVPETSKAWTQGFFNPWSISIEFVATGSERTWPNAALRRGAQVFADAAKRWGIPVRWARTSGCSILRSGITDHESLGCGNTHTDVRPHFPYARFMRFAQAESAPKPKVQFQLRGPGGQKITASSPVAEGEGEHARLEHFLASRVASSTTRDALLRRLHRRGAIVLMRTPPTKIPATPATSTPTKKVGYRLVGPGGQVLARSGRFTRRAEGRRLEQFLTHIASSGELRQATLQRLRNRGAVIVVRV